MRYFNMYFNNGILSVHWDNKLLGRILPDEHSFKYNQKPSSPNGLKTKHTSKNTYLEVSELLICAMGSAGFYHLKVSSLIIVEMYVFTWMVFVIISVH